FLLCVFVPPETGSYVCEFCGKQYKYFNPYQEHVALHTPLGSFDLKTSRTQECATLDMSKFTHSQASKIKSLSKALSNSPFRRKLESAIQTSLVDTNSSQNSSGHTAHHHQRGQGGDGAGLQVPGHPHQRGSDVDY
ncbi:hypothetical protein AMECASPLE_023354, partial [Ameca splendens]